MKKLLTSTLLVLCNSAYATNFKIENVTFKGKGCSENTVRMNISPDRQAITAVYSDFIAEVGDEVRRPLDSKECRVRFEVKLEDNFRLAVTSVEHAGFIDIPVGGSGHFSSSAYIPGNERSVVDKKFNEQINDSFKVSSKVDFENWSDCGGTEVFAVFTKIFLTSNNSGEPAIMSVDSIDADGGLTYNLKVEPCNVTPIPDVEEKLPLTAYFSNENADLFATTSAPAGYDQADYLLGYLWSKQEGKKQALYHCEGKNVQGKTDYYAHTRCDGVEHGILGYVEFSYDPSFVPVFACISSRGNRYLTDKRECNYAGHTFDRHVGYLSRTSN